MANSVDPDEAAHYEPLQCLHRYLYWSAGLKGLIDNVLTLKMPRKPASETVVCLCCLLNILSNFSNLFLHTGIQCGPWSDCS